VLHSAFVTVSFLGVVSQALIPMPNTMKNAVGSAKCYGRSHDAVIRVYDEAGNVIETHEHAGDFNEP
jgi:hypothetical protein